MAPFVCCWETAWWTIKIVGHNPQGNDIEDIHPLEPFSDRAYTSLIYWLLVVIILLTGIWYFRKFWLRNNIKNSHEPDLPGTRAMTIKRLNQLLRVLEKEEKPELISALKNSNYQIEHLTQVKEVLEKTDLNKFAKLPLGINELKSYIATSIEFVQKNPNMS